MFQSILAGRTALKSSAPQMHASELNVQPSSGGKVAILKTN